MYLKLSKSLSTFSYVPRKIEQMREKKTRLARAYWDMYDDFITYGKPIDKTEFDSTVNELHTLETQIDVLEERLRPKHVSSHDDDELNSQISRAELFVKQRANRNPEEVFIWENAWIREKMGSPKTKETRPTTPPPPPKKKQINKKKPKLSEDTKEEITHNIKALLAKNFAFKDKAQCVSKQRSQSYYASKEEIIEKIEKDPELKRRLPSNYKKLTKDKLCELFFNVQNGGTY